MVGVGMWVRIICHNPVSDKLAGGEIQRTAENQGLHLSQWGMWWETQNRGSVVWGWGGPGSPGAGRDSLPGRNSGFASHIFWHLELSLLQPPVSHL